MKNANDKKFLQFCLGLRQKGGFDKWLYSSKIYIAK